MKQVEKHGKMEGHQILSRDFPMKFDDIWVIEHGYESRVTALEIQNHGNSSSKVAQNMGIVEGNQMRC